MLRPQRALAGIQGAAQQFGAVAGGAAAMQETAGAIEQTPEIGGWRVAQMRVDHPHVRY